MTQTFSSNVDTKSNDIHLIKLMRLAFEIGKAKNTGNQELINDAKSKHQSYMSTCLSAINAQSNTNDPVKKPQRMRH